MTDAHEVNGNSKEMILAAKLLVAVDAALQAGRWDRGASLRHDLFLVPSLVWGDVTKAVEGVTRGAEQEIERIVRAVRAVDLRKAYDARTRSARLTISQYAELVEAWEVARDPKFIKAYASEHFNQYGRFPR